MAIPAHKYLDETVMRQAFMNISSDVKHPLIPTIITCLKRRVGSRLLPGVFIDRAQQRRRRG